MSERLPETPGKIRTMPQDLYLLATKLLLRRGEEQTDGSHSYKWDSAYDEVPMTLADYWTSEITVPRLRRAYERVNYDFEACKRERQKLLVGGHAILNIQRHAAATYDAPAIPYYLLFRPTELAPGTKIQDLIKAAGVDFDSADPAVVTRNRQEPMRPVHVSDDAYLQIFIGDWLD